VIQYGISIFSDVIIRHSLNCCKQLYTLVTRGQGHPVDECNCHLTTIGRH